MKTSLSDIPFNSNLKNYVCNGCYFLTDRNHSLCLGSPNIPNNEDINIYLTLEVLSSSTIKVKTDEDCLATNTSFVRSSRAIITMNSSRNLAEILIFHVSRDSQGFFSGFQTVYY